MLDGVDDRARGRRHSPHYPRPSTRGRGSVPRDGPQGGAELGGGVRGDRLASNAFQRASVRRDGLRDRRTSGPHGAGALLQRRWDRCTVLQGNSTVE